MTDRITKLNCCLSRYIIKQEQLRREEYKIRILSTQILAILIAHLENCRPTFKRSLERIITQFTGLIENGGNQLEQITNIRRILNQYKN